jgi:hypothetical protein
MDAIAALADRLGRALLGIVVVLDESDRRANGIGEDIFTILRRFCRAGVPLAWLDRYDSCRIEEQSWDGPRLFRKLIESSPGSRSLFRFHLSELQAVRLTLKTLYEAGHRIIGVPNPGSEPAWLRQRSEYIAQVAREMGKSLVVVQQRECEPLFVPQPGMTGAQIAAKFDAEGNAFLANIKSLALDRATTKMHYARMPADIRRLLLSTVRLGAMIVRHRPTALIAPSDEHAHECYRWLAAAGFSIPRDMTLVSFDDNLDTLYPYPISSVNFGFDYLGYACFHVLLGDLRIPTDRWKSIGARPRINHPGTIGAPGPRA